MGPKRSTKSRNSPKQRSKDRDSPVKSPKSPKSSPQRNELTDVARRVKDCCVTWHETVQKWEKLNSCGLEIAKKYVNLKLQRQFSDKSDNTGVTMLSDLSRNQTVSLEEELQRTSDEFVKLEESFITIHEKMKALNGNFESVRDLENFKAQKSAEKMITPLFETWTSENFVKVSNTILQMYTTELALKKKLIFALFRGKERHALMYCLAAWLHEPYVDATLLLESMFVETSLR